MYQYNYQVGEEVVCCLEPGNPYSPGDNAIVVKAKVEDTGKKEAVVGHIPEPLAQILGPMLKDGTIHSITAEIKGEMRGAPGGVWVRGGGIELPCKYLVYGPEEFETTLKSELSKRLDQGFH